MPSICLWIHLLQGGWPARADISGFLAFLDLAYKDWQPVIKRNEDGKAGLCIVLVICLVAVIKYPTKPLTQDGVYFGS